MDFLVTVLENSPEKTKELHIRQEVLSSDRYSDESINSLGALIEYAAKTYPNEAGFYYPITSESNTAYASITWDQFHHLTNVVAAKYSVILYQKLAEANEKKTQPTVALCGHGLSIEYYITQMALQKLNIRTLLLAKTVSAEAMRSLVQRCSALAIIIESGRSYQNDDLLQIPMFEDPLDQALNSPEQQEIFRFDDGQDPWERQIFIIHSSGSTGPPKPIIHTNRSMIAASRMYRLFPDRLVNNWLLITQLDARPGCLTITPSGYAYNAPTTFPPRSLFSSNSTASAIIHTLSLFSAPSANEQRPQIDCTSCNPSCLAALYHYIRSTTNDFTPLRQLKLVMFFGAPLDRSVLQGLVQESVKVRQIYGSTELGPLLLTYPTIKSYSDIEKMRIWWREGSGLVMEPLGQGIGDEDEGGRDGVKEQKQRRERSGNDGAGLYELVVYSSFPAAALLWGPSSHTGLAFSEPFRTNDLFREVPPKGSGYYVIEGRTDDIITGPYADNINAAAIERKIVAADPRIRNALFLRPGYSTKLGLLVEVDYSAYGEEKERENGDGVNGDAGVHEDKDRYVQDCVRKAVESVNQDLMDWERVEMGMIKVLDRGTKLPVTVKGNVKRKEAERVLQREIEESFGAEGANR